jgi:hypothetical protein
MNRARRRRKSVPKGLYAAGGVVAALVVATGIMLVVHHDHPVTAQLTSCGAGTSPLATVTLHNASGSLKSAHVEVGFYDGLTKVATGTADEQVGGGADVKVLISNVALPSGFDRSKTLTCQLTKRP